MHFLSAHFLSDLVKTDLSGTHPAVGLQQNHHRASFFPPNVQRQRKHPQTENQQHNHGCPDP